MKIYFAAHATSKDNEAKISSGWKDVELSDLGVGQAAELGEHFKNIKLDLICSSDLKRAAETARIAFGSAVPVIADARLRELNYGDFNGQPTAIVEAMKKDKMKEPFPNGESYEQAVERVRDFFLELKEKYSDKTVLVVGQSQSFSTHPSAGSPIGNTSFSRRRRFDLLVGFQNPSQKSSS
ncbi:MAG: histidine phosphatase family protein [Candidatus Sungbacteria bacterium]|nr:histidine phosphatase family protein [Candidatus Sungbacteria bacterium]